MSNYVCTKFKWTAVYWSGKCIVNNQGYAVLVSYLGKLLDIEYSASWVRDGLAKQSFSVRTECCLNLLLAGLG